MNKKPTLARIIKIYGMVCWLVFIGSFVFDQLIGGSANLGYVENGQYFVRDHSTVTEVTGTLWTVSYVWNIVSIALLVLTVFGVAVAFICAAVKGKKQNDGRVVGEGQMCCDLHAHSDRSDGTLSPSALASAAKEAGLSAVALTDHNTVAGIKDFVKACGDLAIEAVPGVEISTEYEGVELHILGLYIPEAALNAIEDYVAQYNVRKEQSSRDLCARLQSAGYHVDYEEIAGATPDGHINRAHIAKALLAKGYVDSVKTAFSTLLGEDKGFYVPPERISALEAVAFIKSVGAVPVWAHPFLQLDESGARRFLAEAVPLGLAGMETRYSLYSAEDEAAADRLIKDFNILPSGGSDFHGEVKPDIKLGVGKGNLCIPLAYAHALRRCRKERDE